MLEDGNLERYLKEIQEAKKTLRDLKENSKILQLENEKSTQFIKDLSKKSLEILSQLVEPVRIDPLQKIKEMILSEGSQYQLTIEWKKYHKWCEDNQCNPFQQDSANRYLSTLKCKISTLVKKRNNLQSVLHQVLGTSFQLVKIKKKLSILPKYALSDSEIETYLKEQKELCCEDYLIQLLLITFGCRINTAGSIKVKDLEFLNSGNNVIFLPDSKTGSN